MQPFKFSRSDSALSASQSLAEITGAKLLAGGTNILDLMKEDVERPAALIDINSIGAPEPQNTLAGVRISALAKNTDTANHPLIRENFPLLSQAILSGASAQIRNMASNGGNLNQRTRCSYFYDTAMPCNKRNPGSGCGALQGENRMHAIFGWSENCVAVHPSDMCVALAVLDATVHVAGPKANRSIAFTDYHRLPDDKPDKDNTLGADEVITEIEIAGEQYRDHSYYLKIRDRSSYAFALVSVAAALELSGNTVVTARIAMGGVAHKPWRAFDAEDFLKGRQASEDSFRAAAKLAMKDAKALAQNDYKISMGEKAVARALLQALNGPVLL
jgi:xanthine dehydrogenase YagS FAD-binding subunit